MDINGGRDFLAIGPARNLPMRSSWPESSSPLWRSWNQSFYERSLFDQTLDRFTVASEADHHRSNRYRSLEEEFSRLFSRPSASHSQSDDDAASAANLDPFQVNRRRYFPSQSNGSSPEFAASQGLISEASSTGGSLAALAMEQRGARVLQTAMERTDCEAEIELVLDDFLPQICSLTVHPFGNYVVQKLIELSNERQRTRIAIALASDPYQLFHVCLDPHGTRVIQRLLELLNPMNGLQVVPIASALINFAVPLTKNSNGHHVIQHCLRHFPDRENAVLLNEMAQHCIEVATDKSGCCVLQQCVEHAPPQIRELLVREIIANAVHLSQDRYGNYVVQHIVYLKMPNITMRLLRALQGNYVALSFGKYGSNVVEKCLKECDEWHVCRIIKELLEHPEVRTLFVDPFGNYVIQSALEVSRGHIRKALIETILCNASIMRSNLYGKKILDWLERRRLFRQ